MTNFKLLYEETGEVRPPRAGEWFRSPQGWEVRAEFDFHEQSFPILIQRLVPDEPIAEKAAG